MMKRLIIIGAGETALLAWEYFTYDSNYQVMAFSVDKEYLQQDRLLDLPVVDMDLLVDTYPPNEYNAFVAISSGKLNRHRKEMYYKVKSLGYTLPSYISSKAFIWRNVEIGENCLVLEYNVLQPFTKIGNNVTLWSGNHIGHRSLISDHCFISSHCVISGYCKVGESSFLGVNCTLEDQVTIGPDNFIGAGSLIKKNTTEKSLFQNSQTELSKVDTHRLFKVKNV